MNILYILGNGFDKAQGLATSYPEFYKYLIENTTGGSDLLQRLKQEIENDIKSGKNLWSDLEIGLGKFTSHVNSEDEMDKLHNEISQHLENYLENIDSSKHYIYKITRERISEDLLHPEKYFVEADREAYKSYIETIFSESDKNKYYAITLNYTNTLEKMLSHSQSLLDNKENEIPIDICHLHGKLGDTIVLGVDNKGQIDNIILRESDIVKNFLVKPIANDSMKNLRNKRCEQLIKDANIIFIFGVSYGDTDSHWWKSIGHEIMSRENICVVNFIFCPNEVPTRRKFQLSATENIERKKIYKKMGISHTSASIDSRFFIEINTEIFQNIPDNPDPDYQFAV